MKIDFWPEFYNKCQKLSGQAVSQFLQFLTLNLGWEQGQESHCIKPSNLTSTLILSNFLCKFFVKTCDEQLIEYTKLKETTL